MIESYKYNSAAAGCFPGERMNRSADVLGTSRPVFALIVLAWPLLANARPSSRGERAAEVMAVSCGSGFSCALQSDGLVSCWGDLNPMDI